MFIRLKQIRMSLLALAVVAAQLAIFVPQTRTAEAADNGLGAKPYMGWSSYSMQVYSGNGQWITADQIKAQSDAMHEKLQSHGYNYINIDAAWNGGMDGYGRPVPSTTLYPDGFQEVIDHIHANGQKVGIYSIPGLSPQAYEQDLPIYGTNGACTMQDIAKQPLSQADYWGIGYKIDFAQPCAQKYIDSIANLYGEWGIDFLKFDSVTPGSGISDLSLDARDDVAAWSQALKPHHIWLELSWALDIKYADLWKKYANGWRVDWDIECYCENQALTKWDNIARLFPIAEKWWRHAGPGGWNDFDSLNIGNGSMDGLTEDERRSAMTFWSISSAQLFTGNDLTNLDELGIELLTNDEAIAINQAGRPAHPLSTDTQQQVWYANNGDGTYTVGLFNLGSAAATVGVDWSAIGLSGPASVRDLWSHSELGTFEEGFSSEALPSHASRLLKVTALDGSVTANDDDTGMRYSGGWQRNGGQELAASAQNLAVTVGDSDAQNSAISPAAASFDKQAGAQADVATTLTLNGNTLTAIANAGSVLTEGDDYTIAGSTVTIRKEYLANRPVGVTNLVFAFSGGAQQTLTVTVSDSTIRDSAVNPGAVSFDKAAPAAVSARLTLNGNTLTGIAHDGQPLAEGEDYTVTGSTAVLAGDYLAALAAGTSPLTFTFDQGNAQTIALVVRDTSAGGVISVNDNDPDANLVYGDGWNYSYNRNLGDYGNDVHFLENNGGYFEYTFNGTGIELITELDPSQGSMDIYVDGELKTTVSTSNIGRAAAQPVYNIANLPNGEHTLKAVKRSGTFMLLDQLRVTVPDLLSPNTAGFDKAAPADVTVTASTYGLQIAGSVAELVYGTDYEAENGQVTIKADYLADEPVGTTNLTFSYENGASQNLAVAVTDSAHENSVISPTAAAFDKRPSAQTDVTTTLTLNGNALTGIANGGHALTADTDYSVSGDTVTIGKAYLAAQPAGVVSLVFTFSEGAGQTMAITVTDTVASSASFDKKAGAQADITAALTLNGGTLTSVDNDGEALVPGEDYTAAGDSVTIGRAYLASLPEGMTNLVFTLSDGSAQTLAIAVRDTARGLYTLVNNDDPAIFYNGGWQSSRGRGVGDYKDDAQFTEKNGDYFEYAFEGTGIEIVTEKHNSQGDMEIYVDGELQQAVSTYLASDRQVQQAVFKITGLTDGLHTIKAVKKSGSYMLLDMLRVEQPGLIVPDTAEFDKAAAGQADVTAELTLDGSSLIGVANGGTALAEGEDYTVDGNTVTIDKDYLAAQPVGTLYLSFSFAGDYKDDLHVTAANGDFYTYTFTGTGIELIGPKGPSFGDMDIYVNGILKQTVSAHSASRQAEQSLYSLAGMANGTHTIKVVKKSGDYLAADRAVVSVSATAPGLALSTAELPDGKPGRTYSAALTASGGTAPYSYAVTSGTLPAGIKLGADGKLTGKAKAPRTYAFTVTVTDGNGVSADKAYTVAIVAGNGNGNGQGNGNGHGNGHGNGSGHGNGNG